MSVFSQLPLGQRIPGSPHSVACSLPTLHDIIGYDFEIGVDRFTGAVRTDGTPVVQQQGFTPPYDSEGHDEGQEFASGNIGLLTAALGYERDHAAPAVTPSRANVTR